MRFLGGCRCKNWLVRSSNLWLGHFPDHRSQSSEDNCYSPKSVSPLSLILSEERFQLPRRRVLRVYHAPMLTAGQDATLAALYVSTKMHDTLKKPREILMVSYAVRFPELAAKSKTLGGEVDMDPMVNLSLLCQETAFNVIQTVEHDRQRLLAVERLILETICFNFTSKMPFPYVFKLGRKLGGNVLILSTRSELSTAFASIQDAHQICMASHYRLVCVASVSVDSTISTTRVSHRTLVPIMYPPNTVALGCLYTSALLLTLETPPPSNPVDDSARQIVSLLKEKAEWEQTYMVEAEDLQGQCLIPWYHLCRADICCNEIRQKLHISSSTFLSRPRRTHPRVRHPGLPPHRPHIHLREISTTPLRVLPNYHRFLIKPINSFI